MKQERKVLTAKEIDQLASDFFDNYGSYFDRPFYMKVLTLPLAQQYLRPSSLKVCLAYQLLTRESLRAVLAEQILHENDGKQHFYLEAGRLKEYLPEEDWELASDYLLLGDKQAYLDLTADGKKLLLPSNKRQQLQHFKECLHNCQSWQNLLDHIRGNHGDMSLAWRFKNQSKLEATLTGRKDYEHVFVLADPEAMKQEYDKFLNRSKKKEADYQHWIEKQIAASDLRGDLLPRAIAQLTLRNETRITPNNCLKILRGLSYSDYDAINHSDYDGHFRFLPNETILQVIDKMQKEGLIAAEERYYADYHVYYHELVPTDLTEEFLRAAPAEKSDLALLKEINEYADKNGLADFYVVKLTQELLQHPALTCVDHSYQAFIAQHDLAREYLKMRLQLTSSKFMKKYLRLLLAGDAEKSIPGQTMNA
ncbi:hypothetical protein [Lactobacillus nasalidis]|nr:hypothetical protein [Lactobacillus nasalidis]